MNYFRRKSTTSLGHNRGTDSSSVAGTSVTGERSSVISQERRDDQTDKQTERTEDYEETEEMESETQTRNADDPIEAHLLPGDAEKSHFFKILGEMRNNFSFCDVSFRCQGQLFRAHRIVVSSWSRWLRAILCESPDEEVITLDVFEPEAFGAALDYMYGVPIVISVTNIDAVIKVIRRLEIRQLEQQCWRYLMTVLSDTNCEILHEIADRYDCPPLKLASWKVLQENTPTYRSSPASILLKGSKNINQQLSVSNPAKGTGLTGPGEASFNAVVHHMYNDKDPMQLQNNMSDDDEDDYDTRQLPSLFDLDEGREYSSDDSSHGSSQDSHDEEKTSTSYSGSTRPSRRSRATLSARGDSNSEGTSKVKKSKDRSRNTQLPDDLPDSAAAAEVVKAWAFRLRDVYDDCIAKDGDDYQDAKNFRISHDNKNARLVARRKGGAAGPIETPSPAWPPSPSRVILKPPTGLNAPLKALGKAGQGGKSIDYRDELKRFYISVNQQDKLGALDKILEIWAGKEEQMIMSLIEKYKDIIPRHMMLHLDMILVQLENQTDSSFVR